MGEVATEDLRMRQFLLGELDEREREELEQRVLTEGGIRDKLLMAEDDLIEEYLEGFLKGEEREKFLRQFLSIPHQRDKLRIAKSLRRFARNEANFDAVPVGTNVLNEADTVPMEPRRISKAELDTVPVESKIDTVRIKHERLTRPLVLPLHRKLLVYAPIAAVVLVAVVVGSVWYVTSRRNETRRQAIERELAELNTFGELNLPPDQISTLIVSPMSTGNVVTIPSTFKAPVLELWLVARTDQIKSYNALLQKVGSGNQVQISNLPLQYRAGGKAVRLRISTRLLTPGVYRVQLNGLSPDGRVAETDEYSFKVE